MVKKSSKKIIEKKISPKEIIESKEPLEEKIENSEEGINNQKFLEFLSISTESIETLASKKPRNIKQIEEDQEVLSMNIQEKDGKEKKEKTDYFARTTKDYDLISPREEKRQDISVKAFQPQRVDFNETGRDIRTPLRETFIPSNDFNRQNFSKRDEHEKGYTLERVDFNEVGREKRYKLMK